MHIAFKQGLDKFDSLNYPNFEPEEIDLILNQAQDAFVKQRYGSNNMAKDPFESSQKRTEDLKGVVVRATALTGTPTLPVLTIHPNSSSNIDSNSVFVDLPADHWIIVQELATIQYTDCHGDISDRPVKVVATQHNDYSGVINNPFSKPTSEKVLRMMTDSGIELLHHADTPIIGYKLTYIKEPQRIDISAPSGTADCELSEMVHQEVVNHAISIALENIEAQRVKTYTQVTENREE